MVIIDIGAVFLHVLCKEDSIKKTLVKFYSSYFMRNGWLKALSQLKSYLQQAVQQQEAGRVSGIERGIFLCIILTSYIEDHEKPSFIGEKYHS